MTLHTSHYLDGNPMQGRVVPRLIGFTSEAELEFFELFCTVDKVGAARRSRRWCGRSRRSPTPSSGRTPNG